MSDLFKKTTLGVVSVLLLLGVSFGIFYFKQIQKARDLALLREQQQAQEIILPKYAVIGHSVNGLDIEAFSYGTGAREILFVGGIHGGYEWNSVLLAYEFINYLESHPEFVPENITVTIIPSANPDGVYSVIGIKGPFSELDVPRETDNSVGRFNANKVDLNRNFDCKWQATSNWRSKEVSAGTKAFSEPEAKAIRDYVLKNNPLGVIFWHSQANAVYASECENGVLPETLDIMNLYAEASDYKAVATFNSYPITGDAEGWLASINIPAITVELKTHEAIDWKQNLAGVKALLNYYKLK